MGIRDSLSKTYLATIFIRVAQLALALTVCGLYGVDLSRARSEHKYQDGKWVYAEVVGGLSAFAALSYLVPFAMMVPFVFVADAILWIMWLVLFGIFGKMYINERPEGDSGIQRMKNAVWVDLTNMLLWFLSAIFMAGYWWKHRSMHSRWTGRAKV